MPNIKLSSLQKEILFFFAKHQFAKNFYWTGGTLLASHYLYNRDSVDLDFFSDDLFTDDEYLFFINDLKNKIRIDKITLTKQYNRRLYVIKQKNDTVKLELVFFPFPPVGKRSISPKYSVKIDSLTDIMVNKTLATYQRNEIKDVFDLYSYLKNNPQHDLFKLTKLVEKKFGVAIEPVSLLTKINKLSDKLDSLSPLLLKPQKNLSQKVKKFFQEIFNSIARKQLK